MTIQEFYAAVGGNYEEAKSRLMNDRLITKFVLKFPGDPTMQSLTAAVEAGNIEESFRGAHTLKGVAANLSFNDLAQKASALTEQLRPKTEVADGALYEAVLTAYNHTIEMINAWQNQ